MSNTGVIVARVPKTVKNRYTAFCDERNLKYSEALHPLIELLLAGAFDDYVDISPRRRGHMSYRIELCLSPEEKEWVKTFAHEDSISVPQWFIYRLLDAKANRMERFIGSQEVKQYANKLDSVQRTIVGMAHNLNQVTRALQACKVSGEPIRRERLLILSRIEEELLGFVREAQKTLAAFDNPRGLPPVAKQNPIPLTPELCEKIRKKLQDVIRAKQISQSKG